VQRTEIVSIKGEVSSAFTSANQGISFLGNNTLEDTDVINFINEPHRLLVSPPLDTRTNGSSFLNIGVFTKYCTCDRVRKSVVNADGSLLK
jgi:hypothetical protein